MEQHNPHLCNYRQGVYFNLLYLTLKNIINTGIIITHEYTYKACGNVEKL